MTDRNLVILAAALAGIAIITAIAALLPTDCELTMRQWDRLQESLMDCREDPDCYITPADLERVRELAPQVQACEAREAGE